MKKTTKIFLLFVIAILATSLALYAGDDKSTKKESSKCPMTSKQGTCMDKNAKSGCPGISTAKTEKSKTVCCDKPCKSECKDHDQTKCKHENCTPDCKHEKCSAECKNKHTKMETKNEDKQPKQ